MTRIAICGGPRTGKTTRAQVIADHSGHNGIYHTDDLIKVMEWSDASQYIADEWLTQPGPWIIEGVAVVRALRKWRDAHPGEAPPVDRVIRLMWPHVALSKGQLAMTKGEETVWLEIEPWLDDHGVSVEHGK